MKTSISEAVKNYLKTTTLHGFKYLNSPYYIDRIGWLMCCAASACCAGVLCAVLWARFSEVPALLTLADNFNNYELMEETFPTIIVCPTTENIADILLDELSLNETEKRSIPITLARLFTGKSITKDQLFNLDDFLVESNVNFTEVMLNNAPDCNNYTKRCRFQETVVPCEQLFQSELTTSGICCKIDPKKLKNLTQYFESRTHTAQMMDMVLQYTRGSRIYGCKVITMYETEEDYAPDFLLPGNLYMAYYKFIVISKNPASDNLMESTCNQHKEYSRTSCMLRCAEMFCGCRDLLHPAKGSDETRMLPICNVTQLECLRGNEYRNSRNRSCNCLPSCKRITTTLVLDSSKLNVQYTVDPFFMQLNTTSSIAVKLGVDLAHSQKFLPIPTDTWVTLLSSLGGVFNMFLGVGLFSALEFLFFILIKLPAALKKSSKIISVAEHVSSVHHQQHKIQNENKKKYCRNGQR